MEKYLLLLAVLISVGLSSCNSNKKSEEIAGYASPNKGVKTEAHSGNKPVGWVKEGAICYGLVVAVNKEGQHLSGKPVKAKVVGINGNEIKMKSMENVSVAEVKGCTKMGLAKGETWLEKNGDLFKTKEEAIQYLKEKKLYLE